MNINRKEVKVDLNGEEMSMVLDFGSAIYYQEHMKESIFKGVNRISKEMDLLAFAYLIASTLRDSNGKTVGIDFVKKLDLMKSTELFMEKFGELMDNSLPEKKENEKKK